jgi:hypothetical protein
MKTSIATASTKSIMCEVALCQKKRLIVMCSATLPILIMLTSVTIYSTQHTVRRLNDKNFFDGIAHISVNSKQVLPESKLLFDSLAPEFYEGSLGIGIASLVLGIFVANKTDITSIRSRFKQTKRYTVA